MLQRTIFHEHTHEQYVNCSRELVRTYLNISNLQNGPLMVGVSFTNVYSVTKTMSLEHRSTFCKDNRSYLQKNSCIQSYDWRLHINLFHLLLSTSMLSLFNFAMCTPNVIWQTKIQRTTVTATGQKWTNRESRTRGEPHWNQPGNSRPILRLAGFHSYSFLWIKINEFFVGTPYSGSRYGIRIPKHSHAAP